jgi:Na+/H+-translocating membrane pyrophosphatase
VGSIIAACTLATSVTLTEGQNRLPLYALPFWLAGVGIICSLIGMTIVGTDKDHVGGKVTDQLLDDLLFSINKGIYLAAGLFFICACPIC